MVKWSYRKRQALGDHPRAVVVGAATLVAFVVATRLVGIGGHNAHLFGGVAGGIAAGAVAGDRWDAGVDAGGRAAAYGFLLVMLLLGVTSFLQLLNATGELFVYWVPALTAFTGVVLFPAFLFGGLAGGVVGSWLRVLLGPLAGPVGTTEQ